MRKKSDIVFLAFEPLKSHISNATRRETVDPFFISDHSCHYGYCVLFLFFFFLCFFFASTFVVAVGSRALFIPGPRNYMRAFIAPFWILLQSAQPPQLPPYTILEQPNSPTTMLCVHCSSKPRKGSRSSAVAVRNVCASVTIIPVVFLSSRTRLRVRIRAALQPILVLLMMQPSSRSMWIWFDPNTTAIECIRESNSFLHIFSLSIDFRQWVKSRMGI